MDTIIALNLSVMMRMKPIDELTKLLKTNKDVICSEYKAHIIGVFGSYARGQQKQGSDIDILVKFNEGATLFDLVGLGDFLEDLLGLKVDIVSERALRAELRNRILAEVVEV